MKKNTVKNQLGNLLVGLLVSLGIIALLATLSVPLFSQIRPKLELNAAARELLVDIRLCRQLAVSEQKNHQIFFNTESNSYQIIKLPDNQLIKQTNLNSNINLSAVSWVANSVAFNSSGVANEAGQIILSGLAGEVQIDIKASGWAQIIK